MSDDLERVYQAKTLDPAPDGTLRGVWLVLGENVRVATDEDGKGRWWRFWRKEDDERTADRRGVGTTPTA